MPQHGHRDWLMDAVQSVIDQTFTDWQMFILTDEKTWDVTAYTMLDDRIKVVLSDRPASAEALINAMAKQLKSEYLALHYADTVSLPKRFEIQVSNMKRYDLDICTAHAIDFHPNKRKYVERMAKFQNENIDHMTSPYDANYASSPTMFMKTRVMQEVPYMEDIKFWSDIAWVNAVLQGDYKHKSIPLPLVYRFDRDKTFEWRTTP